MARAIGIPRPIGRSWRLRPTRRTRWAELVGLTEPVHNLDENPYAGLRVQLDGEPFSSPTLTRDIGQFPFRAWTSKLPPTTLMPLEAVRPNQPG